MVFTRAQLAVCVAVGCTGQLHNALNSCGSVLFTNNTVGSITSSMAFGGLGNYLLEIAQRWIWPECCGSVCCTQATYTYIM
jgi:uncharacterized membrane protein YjjB (DUF3815 family)